VYAFVYGYGYSQGEILTIIVNRIVESFNNLDNLSLAMFAIFIVTIAIIALVWIKSKSV